MRLRKLALALISSIITVIQAVSLGFSIAEDDRATLPIHALHVVFAFYLLNLAATSVNKEYSPHWHLIVHLSSLTFLATTLLGTIGLVPSSQGVPVSKVVVFSTSLTLVLWYSVAALYFVAFSIAVTTPRGPPLHYPSERIYSEKTMMALTSNYHDNVCGVTGMCSVHNNDTKRDFSPYYRRVGPRHTALFLYNQSRYAWIHIYFPRNCRSSYCPG